LSPGLDVKPRRGTSTSEVAGACNRNRDGDSKCDEKNCAANGTVAADATTDRATASYPVPRDDKIGMAIDMK
jgi:hypothetical protein